MYENLIKQSNINTFKISVAWLLYIGVLKTSMNNNRYAGSTTDSF